jgi:lipopolysaccharide core galacturonosyltransferase RgtB
MTAWLKARPERVFLIVAAYFALNVIVRMAMPHALESDEAEQVFFAQWWALGYGPQPPFYNWLQHAVFDLFGVSMLALSATKCVLLFLIYLFYGLTARMLLKDRSWLPIVVLSLLTIPQISFEAQRDLSHTVAVTFAASFFLFAAVLTLKRPSLSSYALLGLASGLGLLAKYNFALLPAAVFVAVLADRDLRARLFDWRIFVSAAIAILLFLPHAVWLAENLQAASANTIGKLTSGDAHANILTGWLEGVGSLAIALIGFAGLTLVVYAVIFRKALPGACRAGTDWTRFFERMILAILAFILLMILVGADNIKDRWLTPLLFLLPLYFCLKLEAAGESGSTMLKPFWRTAAVIMTVIPAALFLRMPLAHFTGDYQRPSTNYTGAFDTMTVDRTPGLVVTDRKLYAGSLRLKHPDIPFATSEFSLFETAHHADADHPILLFWIKKNSDAGMPASLVGWLDKEGLPQPTDQEMKQVAIPYHYARGDDAELFGYAWIIPPAASSD